MKDPRVTIQAKRINNRSPAQIFKQTALLCATLLLVGIAATAGAEPLSLAECIAQAKSNHPGLKTASWDSQRAAEAVRMKDSGNFPRLDAQLGYNMQLAPQAVIIAGKVAETQEPDYLFGGLAATYTLYDFGKREAALNQARLAYQASNYSFDARTSDVVLQVTQVYFGILEAEKLIAASQGEVAQLEQHRRIAQALYDEGVVTKNDLLQADVRLAAVRQKVLSQQNQQANLWLKLNYLTGNPKQHTATLDETTFIPVSDVNGVASDTIMARRGEILALRRSVDQAQAAVDESSSNFFPELYTKLALDYVQNDKVREQAIMTATLGIKINLFDGFASTSARQQAVLLRSQQTDALRQAESQVQLEIDTASNDITVARQQIEVSQASITRSQENLRINQERYRERVGTATEVLDAQTMLTQAQTDYYRAVYELQLASARYQRAIGKL